MPGISCIKGFLTELPTQLAQGFSSARYGDIPRWSQALLSLPKIQAETVNLTSERVGCTGPLSESERDQLTTGSDELALVRSGLDDTMRNAYNNANETVWHTQQSWS